MNDDMLICIVEVLEWIVLVFLVVLDFDSVDVFVWYILFDCLEFVLKVLWIDVDLLVGINWFCDILMVNI